MVIRVLVVILLTAVLAVTVAWTTLPYITSATLTRVLHANAWNLEVLSLRRPVDLNLRVDRIRLVDQPGSVTVDASGIVLRPTSTSLSQLAIDIDQMTVTVEGSDQESPIELQALLGTYLSILPQAPGQGQIRTLELCLPSQSPCIITKLTWWHDGTNLQSRIESGQDPLVYYLHLGMSDHSAKVEFFQSGEKYVAVELLTTWPDMNILHLAGTIGSTDNAPLESMLPALPDEVSVDLHALSLAFDLQLPLETIQQAADLTDYISGEVSVDALGNFKWDQDGLSLESDQPLTANLAVTPDETTINIAPNMRFKISIPKMVQGEAINQQDIICYYRVSLNATTCSSNDLMITASYIPEPIGATLLISDFTLQLNEHNAMSANASIELALREADKARLSAQGHITLKDNEIALISSSLVVDGVPLDRFEIVHSLRSDTGELHSSYSGNTSDLSQWFESPIQGDIDIEQQASWQGSFGSEWQNWPVTVKSSLKGSDLEGEIDGYIFKGGELALGLTGWLPLSTPEPARMSWQEVDVGFPMQHTNMSFNLSLDPASGVVDIQGLSLQTDVLGGTVNSENYAYNSDTGDGYLMLDLENLDLLQVLALEQEDFHAEGKLNGRLPVKIDNDQIYVEDGAVEALAPGGIIQYKPGDSVTSLVESNAQMALVVDTLKNFRYDTLESKVDFTTDGILHLSTSLAGSNPEVEGGRRINFNLNIEEDIGALLESLRLSEDITNRVDEKYRE